METLCRWYEKTGVFVNVWHGYPDDIIVINLQVT
jgi:hypothetical protein